MAKEKILVVDDERDVLDLCKRILQSQGYQVTPANNGYEAIEFAHSEHFDLLLTDIKMPGITGLEIAQILKESDPSIICVTMTGFSTMDMAIDALKLGIDEFILKPFTPKDLNAAIARALEKERLRKENVRLRSLIPLFELNRTLLGTVEEESVLKRLLEISQQETDAYFAAIYLIDDDKIANPIYSKGSADSEHQNIGHQLAELLINKEQQSTVTLNETDQNYQAFLEQLEASSVIAAPLKSQNVNLGVLILARKDSYFAPSDSEFLSVLCGQASIALENARLFTQIQDAYDQLKLLDHMKSEFINIAAHELRTPLAILIGYAAVLEEDSPPEQQQYITNITRNAMRLRALIDDMLNLQVLESGVPIVSQESVNLQEAVSDVVQDLSLMANEKELETQLDIPGDFPEMIVDQQKLDLILVNLIHNAVKFTPAQGQINICAKEKENQAVVSIHNSGSFIPEEKRAEVFDRFVQVEPSLTREHGGAGLGLAIVRGMLDICGGEISVTSSEDEGTTFNFTLPLNNTNLEARKLQL